MVKRRPAHQRRPKVPPRRLRPRCAVPLEVVTNGTTQSQIVDHFPAVDLGRQPRSLEQVVKVTVHASAVVAVGRLHPDSGHLVLGAAGHLVGPAGGELVHRCIRKMESQKHLSR
jgi:hypothetical protein